MKNSIRLLSAALIAALVLGCCTFALAKDELPPVFIPSSCNRLDLPETDGIYDGDPFQTGMAGARAWVTREEVTVPTSCGGTVDLEYVHCVTAVYPAGNPIRKVVAKFRNDKAKRLYGYTITYQVSDKEFYTISYAGYTTTVTEDHYNGEIEYYSSGVWNFTNVDTGETFTIDTGRQQASRTVFRDSIGGVYIHHYNKDQILEGTYTNGSVTLKNGVGKYFGSNTWFLWDTATGKITKYRKGNLRKLSSFVSPRVE